MLLMLLVGWVVVVPALVVGGLLIASSVLGRRARRAGAVEATGLARELGRLVEVTPQPIGTVGDGRSGRTGAAGEHRPVGAAY